MRAVSFFGAGVAEIGAGSTARAAAAAGIAEVFAAAAGRNAGTKGGGRTVADGAGGTSDLATTGGVNGAGADPVGGRTGKLMRTVSRVGALDSFVRGGRLMRTVSFFGSFASAIACLGLQEKTCLIRQHLSLVNVRLSLLHRSRERRRFAG